MLLNLNKEMLINFIEINTISPLDQFEIRNMISLELSILNNINLSLTNIGLYLMISLGLIMVLTVLSESNDKIVSNNLSINKESIFATINNIVIGQINRNEGQIYFPFIYTLFIFIVINNLIGMVPYSFASTSHFVLVISLSFTIVLGSTILGFNTHGLKFFSLLVPAGCPLVLLPLLVIIELISYLARHLSLGLRLGANISKWK